MPELLLHFSIPFALSAPVLGLKRAFIIGLVALLPDLDVLLHVHRSFTHSAIFLSILIILMVSISLKIGRGSGTMIACSLSLLSHLILDLFHSPTPILYPLSNYSYHISPKMSVLIAEKILPNISLTLNMEETVFKSFQLLDAPIFTDSGFMASLILIASPLIYGLVRSSAYRNNSTIRVYNMRGLLDIHSDTAAVDTISKNATVYSKDDVTILIPTLNEQEAIGKVIQEVRECGFKNILVVDGHSSDGTVDIARGLGAQVVYQKGSGKAMAIKTGLELVKTPYVLVMDGDGTYDPRDIENLLVTAVEYGYDEVIGYRVNRQNISFLNRVGNNLLSSFLSLLMSYRIRDACSGMYLLKMDTARNLEISSRGFDVEVEIVAQMLTLGTVAEVPVNYRKRIGKSKLKSFSAGFQILFTTLRLGWQYNPVFLFTAMGSFFGVIGFIIMFWQFILQYLHSGETLSISWTFFGLLLILMGLQSFSIAVVSLLMKRVERRIIQILKSVKK